MAQSNLHIGLQKAVDGILDYKVLASARKVFVIIAIIGFFGAFLLTFGIKMHWISGQKFPYFLHSYFFSFYVAFSVVLVWEVMAMIYTIPYSIADAVGKQFEIMSLIIMRHLFEKVDKYLTISELPKDMDILWEVIITIIGALALYFLTKLFYDFQPHKAITTDPSNRKNFVFVKKIIAVVLIFILVGYGLWEAWHVLSSIIFDTYNVLAIGHIFFKKMFSIMIFFDILMILLTMWYAAEYSIVFRTAAFTISTVLLRIGFSDDIILTVVMSLLSVLFALGVSLVYQRFDRVESYNRSN